MCEYAQHFWKGPTWTFPLFTQYWPTVAFLSFGTNLHKGFPSNCDTSCAMGSGWGIQEEYGIPLERAMWSLIGDSAGLPLVSPPIPKQLRKRCTRNILLRNVTKQSRIKVCSLAETTCILVLPETSSTLPPPSPSGTVTQHGKQELYNKKVGNLTYYPHTLSKVKIAQFQASLVLADVKKSLGPHSRCILQEWWWWWLMLRLSRLTLSMLAVIGSTFRTLYTIPPFLSCPHSSQIQFQGSSSCIPSELDIWRSCASKSEDWMVLGSSFSVVVWLGTLGWEKNQGVPLCLAIPNDTSSSLMPMTLIDIVSQKEPTCTLSSIKKIIVTIFRAFKVGVPAVFQEWSQLLFCIWKMAMHIFPSCDHHNLQNDQ